METSCPRRRTPAGERQTCSFRGRIRKSTTSTSTSAEELPRHSPDDYRSALRQTTTSVYIIRVGFARGLSHVLAKVNEIATMRRFAKCVSHVQISRRAAPVGVACGESPRDNRFVPSNQWIGAVLQRATIGRKESILCRALPISSGSIEKSFSSPVVFAIGVDALCCPGEMQRREGVPLAAACTCGYSAHTVGKLGVPIQSCLSGRHRCSWSWQARIV